MKILVILTGGTIGSAISNGFIAPADGRGLAMVDNYRNRFGNDIEFQFTEPYRALSETLNADKLNMLIDTVNSLKDQGFDGIIITHGTDTLQYSAAALSLAVYTQIPIVLVSSNYPLDDKRSNGRDNFYAAIRLCQTGERGVFVSYRNSDQRILYHRGDRLLRHPEMSDEVCSVGGPYGELVDGRVEFYNKHEEQTDLALSDVKLIDEPGIITVSARPGDRFNYCLDAVKAVLLQPYHSGTLDVENSGFKRFCLEAQLREIPLFVADVQRDKQYATSVHFTELGLIPLTEMPSTTAFMKIWFAISKNCNIKEFMCQ